MNPNDDSKPEDQPEAETRLPYEPPAVISEEVFEIQALACAKTSARCLPNLNS